MKSIKKSTKRLNKIILSQFPTAQLDSLIIFEEFNFFVCDTDPDSDGLFNHANRNWIIGNKENIFVVSNIDENFTVQKLEKPLSFIIPSGFIHPEFQDLVELNYKNFNSYLLFQSLDNKFVSKSKTKPSKI